MSRSGRRLSTVVIIVFKGLSKCNDLCPLTLLQAELAASEAVVSQAAHAAMRADFAALVHTPAFDGAAPAERQRQALAIAVRHGDVGGKWMIFASSDAVDAVWSKVRHLSF